jgi:hypothetical protein
MAAAAPLMMMPSSRHGTPMLPVKPLFEDSEEDDETGSTFGGSATSSTSSIGSTNPATSIRDSEPRRVIICSFNRTNCEYDENAEPRWKRYQPQTGWKAVSLPGVGSDLPTSRGVALGSKYAKASRGCSVKAKSNRSLRLLANAPYDACWKSGSPQANSPSRNSSFLERYPPREQCSVNDAINMMDTMKIGKKIGFSTSVQVMK